MAQLQISRARHLCKDALETIGFSDAERDHITRNVVEAELAGKSSHGLIRIAGMSDKVQRGATRVTDESITVDEHPSMLRVNAKHKPGFHAIYESLEHAMNKMNDRGVVAVALHDIGFHSGYIGDYARRVAERDCIFIGVHNSPPALVPYGAREPLWGTNPLTVSVPNNGAPVVLDMASSKVTYGDVLEAQSDGVDLPDGVAVDEDGRARWIHKLR